MHEKNMNRTSHIIFLNLKYDKRQMPDSQTKTGTFYISFIREE